MEIKGLNTMTEEHYINDTIQTAEVDTNLISDGYHTFGELYEHRIILYMALCEYVSRDGDYYRTNPVWKSKVHSDDSTWEGWFIMGINIESGKQISYHLPDKYWEACFFAKELEKAPPFDGHTSKDVLERLRSL